MNKRPTALPYQREGVRMIEQFGGKALLFDEQGLGKTVQALWTIRRNQAYWPAIVVCPAIVKINWQREAAYHVGMRAAVCSGRRPPRPGVQLTETHHIYVINYDILDNWFEWLYMLGAGSIWFDESQNLGNRETGWTQAAKELSRHIPHRVAMSGTPFMNYPRELWPTLNIVRPDLFPSFPQYAVEYCAPKKQPWGWTYNGATNLEGLNTLLREHMMVRRLKVEVARDLPPKTRSVQVVPLTNREEYEHAEGDFLGWLGGVDIARAERAARAEAVTRVTYLRQLAARGKVAAIKEWLKNWQATTNEKLVVFTYHRKLMEVLIKHFGKVAVHIDGTVTGEARQAAVDQFQRDKKSIFCFIQIRSGGVGITLTSASSALFCELDSVPGRHSQAEDRIHRIGQTKNVFIYYLIAEGTVDEDLAEVVQGKQGNFDQVFDGSNNGSLNILNLLVEKIQTRSRSRATTKKKRVQK